jgi:hypothetical protein
MEVVALLAEAGPAVHRQRGRCSRAQSLERVDDHQIADFGAGW